MNLIVSTCRTLAYPDRLRLLLTVYSTPGITVHELAEALGFSLPLTSHNLKLLASYHLVQTTPSGRYVRCGPPRKDSTANVFLSRIQELLKATLDAGKLNRTLAQVCDSEPDGAGDWKKAFSALVKHLTAYTHLRRLLILRQLATKGPCSVQELRDAVKMSEDAARRQLDKLVRRGIVRSAPGGEDKWDLARGEGPEFRKRLLEIVLQAIAPP